MHKRIDFRGMNDAAAARIPSCAHRRPIIRFNCTSPGPEMKQRHAQNETTKGFHRAGRVIMGELRALCPFKSLRG
jgi:hypothetical protein